MVAVIILLVLLILGELFTLMLQCRRGHSAWGLLRLFRYAHRGYHDKPRIPENSRPPSAGPLKTASARSWTFT
jgi:hypothetical protein